MSTVHIQDGDGEWTAVGTMADDALVLNDPDARDMRIALDEVVDLLAPWRRTAPPKRR
ncbi:hypothetical protein ACIRJ3_03965 [Streptomyces anulatus]